MGGPTLSHSQDRCPDVPAWPRVPRCLRGSCAVMLIFSCIAGWSVAVAQNEFQRLSGSGTAAFWKLDCPWKDDRQADKGREKVQHR